MKKYLTVRRPEKKTSVKTIEYLRVEETKWPMHHTLKMNYLSKFTLCMRYMLTLKNFNKPQTAHEVREIMQLPYSGERF